MLTVLLRGALVTLLCAAGSAGASQDRSEEAGSKWDTKCTEKGCLMFTDVLRGDPQHPANPQHPEYLTIAVGVDRATKRPSYFGFYVPPTADPKQGLSIKFPRVLAGAEGQEADKDLPLHLEFESCDHESCMATVSGGTPEDDKLVNDLFYRFSTRADVLFLYVANGETLRTTKALSRFQRDYKQLVETQLR